MKKSALPAVLIVVGSLLALACVAVLMLYLFWPAGEVKHTDPVTQETVIFTPQQDPAGSTPQASPSDGETQPEDMQPEEPPAEQEEQAPRERVELISYLGSDPDELQAYLLRQGMPEMWYVKQDGDWGYTDDALTVLAAEDGEAVYRMGFDQDCDYAVLGVYYGMPLSEVRSLMEGYGYSLTDYEGNTYRKYVRADGLELEIWLSTSENHPVISAWVRKPLPEIMELSDYLGTNIHSFSDEVGDMRFNGYENESGYENDAVQVVARDSDAAIDAIALVGEGPYAICGIQYGMDQTKAYNLLKENGFVYAQKLSDQYVCYEKGDREICISYGSSTIGYIRLSVRREEPEVEYLLPESNSKYLTEADLAQLTHEELCFARNEIYARHGYIFIVPEVAAFFAEKSWYQGTVSGAYFNSGVFNAYELANINFIIAYENKYYGGSYY